MDKIAAVVVTYNRLELVKKTIAALQKQTRPLDCIIIVNNGSTDGTGSFLDNLVSDERFFASKASQSAEREVREGDTEICVIHQENVGGSGGFWRGIKEAYELGFDWIWCMDDDVFPREECMEALLGLDSKVARGSKGSRGHIGILCPHRIMNGKTFVSESKKVNLSNPFKNTFDYPLTAEEVENNEYVDIEGMAFEGPLIKRDVVEKIGLPNKDLFILYDDTDYSYRAILAGYRVVVVRDALMDKHYFQSTLSYAKDKTKNKWKLAYHIRNSAYICHKYGENIFVRYCGALPFLVHMYMAITFNFIKGHKYKFSDYSLFASMLIRGLKGELGKMNL